MYYLKYRPHTIEEIDNSNVRDVIANILKSKQLPHAFLFVGEKGTGKTSSARIFAKAINCLNNKFSKSADTHFERPLDLSRGLIPREVRSKASTPTGAKNAGSSDINPCNTCTNCLAIDSDSSPDVLEMDAASNRGIDEIRSLIKETAFSPMHSRYRVFIIDEAHMITNDAFNALLKTLEEPPVSVIFILATTNLEKVPKTIQSRSHMVNFGKAKKEDVVHMLNRIVKGEKLEAGNKLLELLSQHNEKSFRDATKMLEELVIQNKLDFDDAKNYLGLRAQDDLLHKLQKEELTQVLVWINSFCQNGGNIKYLLEQLLEDLRITLIAKSKGDTTDLLLTLSDITHLMKLFQDAYLMLRQNPPIESIPLELAVVEFYNYRNSKKIKST